MNIRSIYLFFERESEIVKIARCNYVFWIIIILSPFLFLMYFGFRNFGLEFFRVQHWIGHNSFMIHPILGIPLFLFTTFLALLYSLDLILGRGCYLGKNSEFLFKNRRAVLNRKKIKTYSIKITGTAQNILILETNAGNVRIPLAIVKENSEKIERELRIWLNSEENIIN